MTVRVAAFSGYDVQLHIQNHSSSWRVLVLCGSMAEAVKVITERYSHTASIERIEYLSMLTILEVVNEGVAKTTITPPGGTIGPFRQAVIYEEPRPRRRRTGSYEACLAMLDRHRKRRWCDRLVHSADELADLGKMFPLAKQAVELAVQQRFMPPSVLATAYVLARQRYGQPPVDVFFGALVTGSETGDVPRVVALGLRTLLCGFTKSRSLTHRKYLLCLVLKGFTRRGDGYFDPKQFLEEGELFSVLT